jgi:hypothetical protein
LADNGFFKQSKNILFRERIKENSSCTIQRVSSFISKQQKPLIFHENIQFGVKNEEKFQLQHSARVFLHF